MSHPFISKKDAAVLAIENELPRRTQDYWRGSILILLSLSGVVLYIDTAIVDIVPAEIVIALAGFLVATYLDFLAFRMFANDTYYAGLYSASGSGNYQQQGLTYDAMVVMAAGSRDLTKAFLESSFGQHIYVRAELNETVINNWLAGRRHAVGNTVVGLASGRATTLIDITQAILTHDSDFVHFIESHGITKARLLGAAHLVLGHYYETKRNERWWSRDVLSRRGSLGRNLTLGAWRDYVPYTVPVAGNQDTPNEFEAHYVTFLHNILQSRRDSNVLLVTPDIDVSRVLIEKLQHTYINGTGLGAINTMSIMQLDHDALLLDQANTVSIESALRQVLIETSAAGNMVLVLDNLNEVIPRYAAKGVLFTHLLEEFLIADRLHVIITCTHESYTQLKQNELSLIKRCEEVVVEALTEETLLRYPTHDIFALEAKHNIIFTYHALTTIAKAVYTYDIPLGSRVTELATKIAAECKDQSIITHDIAERSLSNLLDLPIGPLSDHERDILLSIERIMQQEIVGQERALRAIGVALRRMRAAMTDTNRPLASFLFLGPSGVGKTETAKVLARVYFDTPYAVIRLDMSEFADASALNHLLGSAQNGGLLQEVLQNHPRGLLLLDEFEKSHKDVQELFLQILDEGHITTYQGTVLHFHHHIIIATSNAGSKLIAQTRDNRATSPTLDSDVIANIIRTSSLSPELIGRFGDVILFDPLTITEETSIAHQRIAALSQKMYEQGFILSVAEGVAQSLVNQYHNNQFGARPIRHAIEHVLEDIIATRIIRGDVKPGDTITITKNDLPQTTRT